MKVVLEVQHSCTPVPRGIPIYTTELIKSLLKRNTYDYTLTFFDKDKERNNRQYIDENFGEYAPYVVECNSVSYKDLMNGDEIYKTATYNEITGAYGDVFHFTHIDPIPKRFEGKMVVTLHDVLPVLFPLFFSEISRNSFNRSLEKMIELKPTLIVDSQATKSDVIKLCGYEDIYVIPLGYNSTMLYSEKNQNLLKKMQLTEPYLLYVGAIDPRKGIVDMMQAFSIIKQNKEYKDLKLVLAGNYLKESPLLCGVNEEFNNNKYKEDIIFTGYVTDEEKRWLLSSATAFLFPSEYEGFGLPIIEAMACGCPVITTNVSSLPEAGGDAALYVSPKQPEDLATQIIRLFDSKILRDEFIQKGYAHSKKFTWDRTAELTEAVYRNVCKS